MSFSEVLRERYKELAEKHRIQSAKNIKDATLEAQLELYAYLEENILTEHSVALDEAVDRLSAPKIDEVGYVLKLIYYANLLSKDAREQENMTPKADFKSLMELRDKARMRCLVYNPDIDPYHLDVVCELVNSMSQHQMSLDKEIENLQACLSSMSGDSTTNLCETIAKSKLLSAAILPPYQIDDQKETRFMTTLNDVITTRNIVFVEGITYSCQGFSKTELRLSKVARQIIRGILLRLNEVHDGLNAYGELRKENILLDDEYRVKLRHIVLKPDRDHKISKFDYQSLKSIIQEFIECDAKGTPEDVKFLLSLLDKPRGREWMLRHHSCLWSPSEVIKNLLLFTVASTLIKPRSMDADLEKELAENWTDTIPKGSIYYDCLVNAAGDIKYGDKLFDILEYLRAVLSHECSRAAMGKQCLLETERDLFVLLPKFLPYFLELTQSMTEITSIYT